MNLKLYTIWTVGSFVISILTSLHPMVNIRQTKKPLNPWRYSRAFGYNVPRWVAAAPLERCSSFGAWLAPLLPPLSRCRQTVAPSWLLPRPITADLLCHFFVSQTLLVSDIRQRSDLLPSNLVDLFFLRAIVVPFVSVT